MSFQFSLFLLFQVFMLTRFFILFFPLKRLFGLHLTQKNVYSIEEATEKNLNNLTIDDCIQQQLKGKPYRKPINETIN